MRRMEFWFEEITFHLIGVEKVFPIIKLITNVIYKKHP